MLALDKLNQEQALYKLNEGLPLNRVAFPDSYTYTEIAASRLAAINPNIKELISRLKLVDENELPVDVIVTPDQLQARDIATLQRIAAKALQIGQGYSKADIVQLISRAANVTRERALNGFDQMLCNSIIIAMEQ